MGALNLKEAAAKLRRNPEVLRRNVDIWGVPYKRYSPRGRYVFTDEALEAYLANRQAPSEEEKCLTRGREVANGISVSAEYANLLGLKSTQTPKPLKTS